MGEPPRGLGRWDSPLWLPLPLLPALGDGVRVWVGLREADGEVE